MSTASILDERKERILKAVSLKRPDRVPVVLEYVGFAASVTNTPMAEFVGSPAKATKTMIEAYKCIGGGDVTTPLELLCGARSLDKFFLDLVECPGKVAAVMDEIVPCLAKKPIENAHKRGYPVVWIGGWRAAPAMISPEMWERFVWTHFKSLVNKIIDSGLIPLLHLDSNWERELGRFRDLPKGKVIMALDGDTDIFNAKSVLGGHMCLMGDVPASLLAFGSSEEVYSYSRRLINEIGPNGFILQS